MGQPSAHHIDRRPASGTNIALVFIPPDDGRQITRGVAGIPTAVMGEAGEGGPVIAILGEFDALPGLSQVAGLAEARPVIEGGNGHGCGHNLLGAGSMLAAAAVKDYLAATIFRAGSDTMAARPRREARPRASW